jgi:all-trans-retinol 13,14-reductase
MDLDYAPVRKHAKKQLGQYPAILTSPRGEIYGIDHHVDPFSPRAAVKLRPDTSIPGMYLTGHDILSCGFAGAMFSGVITASAVLKRNLFADMGRLQKALKKKKAAMGGEVENEAVRNGSVKPDD